MVQVGRIAKGLAFVFLLGVSGCFDKPSEPWLRIENVSHHFEVIEGMAFIILNVTVRNHAPDGDVEFLFHAFYNQARRDESVPKQNLNDTLGRASIMLHFSNAQGGYMHPPRARYYDEASARFFNETRGDPLDQAARERYTFGPIPVNGGESATLQFGFLPEWAFREDEGYYWFPTIRVLPMPLGPRHDARTTCFNMDKAESQNIESAWFSCPPDPNIPRD